MDSSQKKVPGLTGRSNKTNKPERLYWKCSQEAARLGFEPRLVRLHEIEPGAIEHRCQLLQAEMLEWIALKRGSAIAPPGQMTVAQLFRMYRERESSPFHELKWNTARTYSQMLDSVEYAVGTIRLADINIETIHRWYNDACYPEGRGRNKPARVRKAHGIISILRRTVSYGVACELPDCVRLHAILSNMRFKMPPKRTSALMAHHVEMFIDKAVAQNRFSLALGTALQFELGMRQRDVIGEWEPLEGEAPQSAYVLNRRQWVNGLQWTNISPDMVLTKKTTKTGQVVTHDLTLCPMSMALIETIPPERRAFGPIIIDELHNRPYAEHAYQRHWRVVADMAGLPRSVWNMDARSGAATEASDAGASLGDTRMVLGHSDERTTARYVRGEGLEKTRRVAKLRLAHRLGGQEPGRENES